MPRLRSAGLVVLALPALMAPGRCGFVIDYTETVLFPEEIQRVVIDADDGSVIATSYEREAALLKRHTFGFEPSLGLVQQTVDDDGTLLLAAHCKYEGNCSFDHMLEVSLGVGFDITMKHSEIRLGYIQGDIAADFDSGLFEGVRLESPNVDITLPLGDITLDHAVAPASVTIEVDDGSVALTLPPGGSYQCNLDAGGAVAVDASSITCDAAAEAVLDITVKSGDITVKGAV